MGTLLACTDAMQNSQLIPPVSILFGVGVSTNKVVNITNAYLALPNLVVN